MTNNSYQISIQLDRPERCYMPDERISGHIIIDVLKTIPAVQVTVRNTYRTHGNGNTHIRQVSSQPLFSGQWLAGEHYSYPFEFTAADAPLTYHGQVINLDWYIQVTVKVDKPNNTLFLTQKNPPDISLDYLLVAPVNAQPCLVKTEPVVFNENNPKLLLWAYAVFGCFSLYALGHFRAYVVSSNGGSLMVAVTFALIAALLGWFIHYHRRVSRLGVIKLQVAPQLTHNRLAATVQLQPNSDIYLDHINAELVFKETTVSRSGSSKETITEETTLFATRAEVQQTLASQQDYTSQKIVIELPETLVATFEVEEHSALWQLHLDIVTDKVTIPCEPNLHIAQSKHQTSSTNKATPIQPAIQQYPSSPPFLTQNALDTLSSANSKSTSGSVIRMLAWMIGFAMLSTGVIWYNTLLDIELDCLKPAADQTAICQVAQVKSFSGEREVKHANQPIARAIVKEYDDDGKTKCEAYLLSPSDEKIHFNGANLDSCKRIEDIRHLDNYLKNTRADAPLAHSLNFKYVTLSWMIGGVWAIGCFILVVLLMLARWLVGRKRS